MYHVRLTDVLYPLGRDTSVPTSHGSHGTSRHGVIHWA